MEPFVILNNNLIYIVLSLTVIIILLSIFCIIMFFRLKNIEKKYNFFSSDGFTDKNLEENILRYIEDVRDVKSKYSKTLKYIQDIDKNIQDVLKKLVSLDIILSTKSVESCALVLLCLIMMIMGLYLQVFIVELALSHMPNQLRWV